MQTFIALLAARKPSGKRLLLPFILLIHNYQQTEIEEMRCMDNTKPVDSPNSLLKSYKHLLTAFLHMLGHGLEEYPNNFFVLFLGDWPNMHFFMR